MNILLLGETGTGKSTFINGLATYFTFESLEDAEHGFEPLVPIKLASSGGLVQLNTKYNNNDNENTEIGASATQQPTSYVLGWKGQIIHLLDTPGIGDTRGVEQDEKNIAMILQQIKSYPMIHGICILVKNNQTRLTQYFTYCIKQILAHLHADAVRNIVFVITHGRSNNFDAKGCQYMLQRMIDQDLYGIGFELNSNKIYCVDNEPVRYLAQSKLKILFSKPDEWHREAKVRSLFRSNAEYSWESSNEAIYKLLTHFCSLTPHHTAKTYNFNQAREVCLALGGPLATITSQLLEKQSSIQTQKNKINQLLQEGQPLQNALSTEVKQIRRVKEAENFHISCTSSSCSRIVVDNGQEIKIPSYCIPKYCTYYEKLGILKCGSAIEYQFGKTLINLSSAGAINLINLCPHCDCSLWYHVATDYKIIEETIQLINPKVQEMIKDLKSKEDMERQILLTAQTEIQKLEAEISILHEAQIQTFQFVKQNSRLDCTDIYLERMEMLRDEEELRQASSATDGGVSFKLEQLNKAIASYKKKKEIFDTSIQGSQNDLITLGMIQGILHNLYSLELHGHQIKAAVEKKLMSHMEFKQIVHEASLSRWNLSHVADDNDEQ